MITQLMIYGIEVGLLVSAAAWAAERIAIWRGRARRGCWTAAMLLSVVIPIIGILAPPQTPPKAPPMPQPVPTVALNTTPSRRQLAPIETLHSPAEIPPARTLETTKTLEGVLRAAWWLGSGGLFLAYVFLTLRLRLAARNWRREQIEGQQVWITQSLGPAVYGFFNPRVLLPEWLVHTEGNERTVALAHERSHLEARDPALLLLGLTLIALLPWNLPLWWQLRRLRFAIEVDCDARVLKRGMAPRDYGSALLAIGERGNGAPLGAVALTEPASQLLQRIQIMTTDNVKPSRVATAATVVLALVCVGVAARTQAPAVTKAGPLKLPAENSKGHPELEALVRATYPQFFQGTGNTQPELLNLFLNPDGSLYQSIAEEIEPRPYITTSLQAFEKVGIDYEHRGRDVRIRLNGASGLPVDVVAWHFQGPTDATRDVATVRSKVRARYADLFNSATQDTVITVSMTEAGDIERASVENLDGRKPESLATESHFGEAVGLVGVTTLWKGHFKDDPDAKDIPVVYGWPRRPNEQTAKFEVFDHGALAAPDDDRAVDRLLAEKYFPDLYTHSPDWPRADPWILLDRQGKVLTSGRRIVNSEHDVRLNIESLYPGIKTERWQIVTLVGPKGQRPDVSFVWIAADSPVTDPSKADFSKQPDALIYADLISPEKTFYTQMLALNFGSSGTTLAAVRNPFGVVHLQLTIDENDSESATVRMRAQHQPLPANEAIPGPLDTAWSAQSAPVRATYGEPSEAQVTDADGKKWKVVLHVDRLRQSAQTVTARSS